MRNLFFVLLIIFSSCSTTPEKETIPFNGADTLKIMMDSATDDNPKVTTHKYNGVKFKHPKFHSAREEKYILKYYKTAQEEQKKYGIPASITLAQGILESASGTSQLTQKTNNHFGIKWTPNHKGGYVIAKDDKPDDRFRKYKSAWYSFRDRSKFLQAPRYEPCRDCGNNWKCWAVQLKKCGYATSKKYTESIVAIVKRNKLYVYDKTI